MENFRKAIEIDSRDIEAYNNLGHVLKNIGDLKGAVENFSRAIKIDPQSKESYFNLGVALY